MIPTVLIVLWLATLFFIILSETEHYQFNPTPMILSLISIGIIIMVLQVGANG